MYARTEWGSHSPNSIGHLIEIKNLYTSLVYEMGLGWISMDATCSSLPTCDPVREDE